MKLKKNKLSKKKINIILILLILVLGTIGVTFAYYNSEDAFENRFNAMKYDVSIEEEFYNTWGTKKVKFRNNDSAAVVLRVSYNELWRLKEISINDDMTSEIVGGDQSDQSVLSSRASDDQAGLVIGVPNCRYNVTEIDDETVFTLSNKINGEDVVTKNWTEGWSLFTKGNDGWYYYSKILDANDEVQILDSIELNEELIMNSSCYKSYNDFRYELSFNYEVIQADKNAISEIWGYDVNISEGNIAWGF